MKMENWLIVLDLDGTILNDDGITFHKFNKTILDELRRQGHIVAICTGRPLGSSLKIYHELEMDTIVGNYNGGRISHPLDSTYKEKHLLIKKEIINKILKIPEITKGIINFVIEFQNKSYKLNDDGHLLDHLTSMANMEVRSIKTDKHGELKVYSDPFSMLIDIKGTKDVTSLFNTLVKEVGNDVFVRFWSIEIDGSFVIELNPRKSNKYVFVKEAAKKYNVDLKNSIAFGDGDNDIQMLRDAKVGVAMLNASNTVKSYANHSTKQDNNDAGVGRFLNDFFKLNIE